MGLANKSILPVDLQWLSWSYCFGREDSRKHFSETLELGDFFPGFLLFTTVDSRNPGKKHLRLVVYPISYRALYIPGGDGRISGPSTVPEF